MNPKAGPKATDITDLVLYMLNQPREMTLAEFWRAHVIAYPRKDGKPIAQVWSADDIAQCVYCRCTEVDEDITQHDELGSICAVCLEERT